MTQKIICQLKCEYNDVCQGNIDFCIVRTFHQLLLSLTHRQRQVIILRYGLTNGEKLSLTNIAKKLYTTVDNVKELELMAIKKLQRPLYANIIQPIVETLSADDNSPYTKLFKAIFGIDTISKDNILIPKKQYHPVFKKNIDIIPKDTLIEKCDFYSRTYNYLRINEIKTIADLTELNANQLSKILPPKSRLFIEVYLMLDAMELRLADCPRGTYDSVAQYLTDVLLIDKNEVTYMEKVLREKCRIYRLLKIIYLIFRMYDIRDIANLSRQDLIENLFLEKEIKQIEEFLNKFNLNLTLDSSDSSAYEYEFDDDDI